jgi:hypothetical protein
MMRAVLGGSGIHDHAAHDIPGFAGLPSVLI